jgi:hypothetical protein
MILTICVIRRRDSMKENEKEMQMKSEKHNFITSWLKCLSASTKDIQRINMSEKVKDTNKQMAKINLYSITGNIVFLHLTLNILITLLFFFIDLVRSLKFLCVS